MDPLNFAIRSLYAELRQELVVDRALLARLYSEFVISMEVMNGINAQPENHFESRADALLGVIHKCSSGKLEAFCAALDESGDRNQALADRIRATADSNPVCPGSRQSGQSSAFGSFSSSRQTTTPVTIAETLGDHSPGVVGLSETRPVPTQAPSIPRDPRMGGLEKRMFSIAILGNSFVGKTEFIRTLKPTNKPLLPTIAVDFEILDMQVENYNVRVTVWDTAGTERFADRMPFNLRKCDGVILMYSVVDSASFKNLSMWHSLVRLHCSGLPLLIAANKQDKSELKVISDACGERLAEEWGACFMPCSAKSGQNVWNALSQLVKMLLTSYDQAIHISAVDLAKEENRESPSCGC